MAIPLGVSFDPTSGSEQYTTGSGPNRHAVTTPVQEAIKLLSLRLPKVVGANAISPRALLTSPGSAGAPVDSVVQKIIQKYFPQASPETLDPMFAPVVGQPSPDRSNTMPVSPPVRYPGLPKDDGAIERWPTYPRRFGPPRVVPGEHPIESETPPQFQTPASPDPPVEYPGRDEYQPI